MTIPDLDQIKTRLAAHRPQPLATETRRQAAVAMLLHPGEQSPEVLLIRRAEHEGDPWSGDLGFPGGGLEAEDRNAREAAERETWEELSLTLAPRHYLGHCAELAGAYLPVQISCFAYLLDERPEFVLSDEVTDTFWVPLTTLLDPRRNRRLNFEYRGQTRQHPIIDLAEWSERPLWGITYRLLQQFFALLDLGFQYQDSR